MIFWMGMGMNPGSGPKLLPKVFLSLALVQLLPLSCQRRPQAPAPPASPNYYVLAEKHFDEGNYDGAAEAYQAYLANNPSSVYLDRVLFRLALVHAFPESPVHDRTQTIALLQKLVSDFPQSPYKPEAEFLLALEAEMERLRSDISRREGEIRRLQQELATLQAAEGEIEKLRADVTSREERIHQLTQELEKLKQIDMQRRPPSAPRP